MLAWAAENGISGPYEEVLAHGEVHKMIENEIAENVSAKNGFRPFERINRIALLAKSFTPGVELSAKQEIMRFKVLELYAKEVRELFR